MNDTSFIIKGDLCWSSSKTALKGIKDGYIVVIDGKIEGVYSEFPEAHKELPLKDYTGKLIIPGMTDIHVHAPQYSFRGLGMDLELLDWLNTHTFPEESKYKDLAYADRAYSIFAEDLKNSATTRAVIFGTLHVDATKLLMDKLEATGLKTYVGKVNMDRNSPDYLCEASAEEALENTRKWIEDTQDAYKNTKPIITPRFTPTCTDELMAGLGDLKQETGVPLQSHLSENIAECEWVQSLCPWSSCYGETYEKFGQLSDNSKSVMAHCVYSTDEEIGILMKHGTYVGHCPQSNADLSSGIAPIRKYLGFNMNIGLGTDVAGGANLSMFRAIADAIAVSKLRWRCVDQTLKPLTVPEAFWIATAGGGSFFGKVGAFDKDYEFDALVLDDSGIKTTLDLSVSERTERYCYLAEEGGRIHAKFVAGSQVL